MTEPMTDARLAEIEEHLSRASWWDSWDESNQVICKDIPDLIAEIRRLRSERADSAITATLQEGSKIMRRAKWEVD